MHSSGGIVLRGAPEWQGMALWIRPLRQGDLGPALAGMTLSLAVHDKPVMPARVPLRRRVTARDNGSRFPNRTKMRRIP